MIIYLLSPIFIILEIYQTFNRDKVYKKIDVNNIGRYDHLFFFFFYLTRIFYTVWKIVGVFNSLSILFILLIIINLNKITVLYTNDNILINVYELLSLVFNIFILSIIFYQGFSQLL